MSVKSFSRREFIKKNSLAGMGVMLASSAAFPSITVAGSSSDVPAMLGGTPVHTKGWIKWPIWNQATDEKQVLESLRSGVWSRASIVTEFERKWAQLMGSKRCVSVVNGTNALIAALTQAGIANAIVGCKAAKARSSECASSREYSPTTHRKLITD